MEYFEERVARDDKYHGIWTEFVSTTAVSPTGRWWNTPAESPYSPWTTRAFAIWSGSSDTPQGI